MPKGQCHCGAVRYEMPAEAIHQALCHCTDCRRHSGAPMVAWGLVPNDQLKVDGETKEYESSEHGRRHFCPLCGTGLFYTNAVIFPGTIDVQVATLDDPDEVPPTAQIQVADRIGWMERLDEMPQFTRYPECSHERFGHFAEGSESFSRYPRYPQACTQIFRFPDSGGMCMVAW